MDYNKFMLDLASESPAPGGGSASAMAGIVSASLVSMVANLTLGKKGYESVEGTMKDIVNESNTIIQRLEELMKEDTDAFLSMMNAMKLPKETQEEKDFRKKEMERTMKLAIGTPWKIAVSCHRILRLGSILARIGNKNAVTDAGASMNLAYAALESSLLNVRINLSYMKNEEYTREERMKLRFFMEDAGSIYRQGKESVQKVMGAE
ncbi:MAG: cyclodeaminase/cyclohydrolase family protein [Candidatus Thermoplasmatota archaeon]|jgi:formiminotetrahydrofolate cyclodeaminase|nr:cyclodeaminase/cyclohydrolase family protein [Candidatus Thermoplasmatota archaeon]